MDVSRKHIGAFSVPLFPGMEDDLAGFAGHKFVKGLLHIRESKGIRNELGNIGRAAQQRKHFLEIVGIAVPGTHEGESLADKVIADADRNLLMIFTAAANLAQGFNNNFFDGKNATRNHKSFAKQKRSRLKSTFRG